MSVAQVRVFEKGDPEAYVELYESRDIADRRVVTVVAQDAGGFGVVWLTPKRARKLAKWLTRMADQLDSIEGEEV